MLTPLLAHPLYFHLLSARKTETPRRCTRSPSLPLSLSPFDAPTDPWKSGGIVKNSSAPLETDVIAFVIEGGAHHLDLRAPNAMDPDSVIVARNMERAAIQRWVAEWQRAH